jgi:hypothetical protein
MQESFDGVTAPALARRMDDDVERKSSALADIIGAKPVVPNSSSRPLRISRDQRGHLAEFFVESTQAEISSEMVRARDNIPAKSSV